MSTSTANAAKSRTLVLIALATRAKCRFSPPWLLSHESRLSSPRLISIAMPAKPQCRSIPPLLLSPQHPFPSPKPLTPQRRFPSQWPLSPQCAIIIVIIIATDSPICISTAITPRSSMLIIVPNAMAAASPMLISYGKAAMSLLSITIAIAKEANSSMSYVVPITTAPQVNCRPIIIATRYNKSQMLIEIGRASCRERV